MSDSKPKSKHARTGHAGSDLRLSVIQRGFPHYTQRQIQRWAKEATDETLDVVSAVEDLKARGKNLSVKTVADFLNISPATFYRRGYNRHFKMSLAFLRKVSPPVQKDSLAEASALTWWLDPN